MISFVTLRRYPHTLPSILWNSVLDDYSRPNSNFYGYFTPILDYMPQNCSSDVQAVIAYLDGMYAVNDTAGIQTLKENFGLGDVEHVDDFADARE
jgi:hypothetical protein